MKGQIVKWLLTVGFLFCFYPINDITANANKVPLEDASQQEQQENPEDAIPDLRGGSENPERERQQPVDLRILQQRYPDVFFLQGASDQNQVALTFDDGPDPRFTNEILDVLNQYGVPATFFLLGSRTAAYPEIVTRIQNEGHVIGNHTYFHPNLVDEADIRALEQEAIRTEDELYDMIGYRTHLFRPPYGFLYDELVEQLARMNYSVIGWSVDSLDWQEDPPEVIASNVLDNIHPGAVILMHDGAEWEGDRTNTIESLHQIIPSLQEQGYEFVTVPQLLNIPFEK
ncbi:polysaccharide deacetylase family protein [Oceanobacillus sp. FSL K6-2867]|uniref:polysaccharide deacetylase family protein n=1 Tax=Oceanobacillus sp. FSL K6-2867 TaxID=2954748 RepID=UPI0030DCA420